MGLCIQLKWISLSFTVLYVMLAVADLAVSVSWCLHSDGVDTGPAENWLHFNRVLIVLILLGIFLGIAGLLGCVAALRDALGWLVFSTVCVLMLACGFIVVAVFLDTRMADAEHAVKNTMISQMQAYNNTDFNETISYWDNMQRKYNCCGIESADDWSSLSQLVPQSCYPNGGSVFHSPGCLFHSLIPARKAVEGTLISTGVMAGILFLGFICNVMHCCLLRKTRDKEI
ncbi:CD63 antigen-like [Paramacrobiotus metropolitanus]|uniref:CD63 antigen-like n=1 Tax=Paramacrobiotus metropolitanus TaxID=2943436 RepID=UPI0024461ACA|nr:CD63 antigen-like [Paramacrobiotus metropolitanus]